MRCLVMTTWTLFLSIQMVYAEPTERANSAADYHAYIQRVRQLEAQDRAAALVELDRALDRFPERVGFQLKRCELLLELGRVQAAKICLDEAGLRFPAMDPDWRKVFSQLRLRASRSTAPPPLISATATPLLLSSTTPRRPEKALARLRWWWTALGAGIAAVGIGLIVGLVPRPHDSVEWQP